MTRLITDDGTDSFFDLEMVFKNILVLCSVGCFVVVCFGMVYCGVVRFSVVWCVVWCSVFWFSVV